MSNLFNLQYRRIRSRMDIDRVYQCIEDNLWNLVPPTEIRMLGEAWVMLPPSKDTHQLLQWRTDEEIEYYQSYEQPHTTTAAERFWLEAWGNQALKYEWIGNAPGQLAVYQRGAGNFEVSYHMYYPETNSTHNAADEIERLSRGWDLSSSTLDGQLLVSGDLKYPYSVIRTGSVGDLAVPRALEISRIPRGSEAIQLIESALDSLSTSKGSPNRVTHTLKSDVEKRSELEIASRTLGGSWGASFLGEYINPVGLQLCDELAPGHYPLLSWDDFDDTGHARLRFQLALTKRNDNVYLDAYSNTSDHLLDEALAGLDYQVLDFNGDLAALG